jgi:hypothetical protein
LALVKSVVGVPVPKPDVCTTKFVPGFKLVVTREQAKLGLSRETTSFTPPEAASRLCEIIEAAEGFDESQLLESGYAPPGSEYNKDSHMVFDVDGHHH